jgi:hypothetical protein
MSSSRSAGLLWRERARNTETRTDGEGANEWSEKMRKLVTSFLMTINGVIGNPHEWAAEFDKNARARIARRNRRAETSQVSVDPLLRREGISRNGWQPTADALLTMERLRQAVAASGNSFRLFPPLPR